MVWLEVGTGTGVLAQCALRAGQAKFIHCVEAAGILPEANVIFDNPEFKGKYKYYHGRIEEMDLDPIDL